MTVLEVDRLSKAFGGIVVADQLSIAVRAGEILGLIGPNGAGKTSLLNLVCGAVRGDSGMIRLNGRRIDGLSMHARARLGVSRTWQHVRLFPSLSVIDNVVLGLRHFPDENPLSRLTGGARARRARHLRLAHDGLGRVGLDHLADRFPGELSFGQQKLVALVRALMTDGDCLLLDEPLAGVEGRLYEVIKSVILEEAARGRAVCAIEHDIAFIKDLCPHAIFMFGGRVLAQGTVGQLLARHDLADLYFGETE